jgi:hypothetical protein
MKRTRPFCDGIKRRDFVRVGSAGIFGFGMGLPQLLELEARAAASPNGEAKSDVSVIYIFLLGGMSTIDTFDLKPDAPAEVRGEFDPIPTSVPGIEISEHLPNCASHADKFSLIRSFGHGNSGHGMADKFMLTGYLRQDRPSFGSVVSHLYGSGGLVPPYVVLPRMHDAAGSSFLGSAASPFLIDKDPSAPGFSVPDLAPPLDIDPSRFGDRSQLLGQVDRFQKNIDSHSEAGTFSEFREKAFALMTSPAAKKAFDIQAEPDKLRQEYGSNNLGQSCLLARRLVESGVRYVMINHNNWDNHQNVFGDLKTNLLPQFDRGFATLLRDLSDRGMLEKTLVVVSGEFGRTPKINQNAGRDHWGPCFTLTLAGGGIQGGRVVGKSDKWAAKAVDRPVGAKDFAATVYHLLGIDSEQMLYTANEKRPIQLLDEGHVVTELI